MADCLLGLWIFVFFDDDDDECYVNKQPRPYKTVWKQDNKPTLYPCTLYIVRSSLNLPCEPTKAVIPDQRVVSWQTVYSVEDCVFFEAT